MLMLFSAGIRRLPTERLIPFDDSDLMLMVSPTVGLRLANMITEDGEKFKIGDIMEQKKEIFECDSLKERMEEFAEIREGRFERFFVSKKAKYLFFDQEEQKYLKQTMFALNLNCSVEIYIQDIDGFQRIELEELPAKRRTYILNEFKRLMVRTVLDVKEYYDMFFNKNGDSDKNIRKDVKEKMEKLFSKYPKLKLIKTKKDFKRYKKFLSMKYHPDVSEENGDIIAKINNDFDTLKDSSWYKNLEDEDGEANG